MKILKRNDEFKKVSENNMIEVAVVRNLLIQGWKYCSKQEYKNSLK